MERARFGFLNQQVFQVFAGTFVAVVVFKHLVLAGAQLEEVQSTSAHPERESGGYVDLLLDSPESLAQASLVALLRYLYSSLGSGEFLCAFHSSVNVCQVVQHWA